MMLNKNKDAKRLVEAILFAADEPLDIETIKSKIELNVDVLKILKELQSEFIERGINLYEISNKWSFRTAENLSKKIASEVVQQRSAGLIDSRLDRSIFGTNKFAKDDLDKQSKEDIFSNIDDMLSETLNQKDN